MIKNIIFDFDGTLVDSAKEMMDIFDKLSSRYGYKSYGSNNLKLFRKIGTDNFIYKINIKKDKIKPLLADIQIGLSKRSKNIKPTKGIIKFLKTLQKEKYLIGVITTNTKNNVIPFFKKNGLIDPVFILEKAGLYGKGNLLKKAINKYELNNKETVYIGDEVRDITSASENKCKSIAVTWGLSSNQLFIKNGVSNIANTVTQLKKMIKAI